MTVPINPGDGFELVFTALRDVQADEAHLSQASDMANAQELREIDELRRFVLETSRPFLTFSTGT